MKKIRLISTGTLFLVAISMFAQQIPQDSKVRTGLLTNGLTYYIRYNKLPEQRVNFHIAQKVGSIQEEDNQRGLAHFLEHMAFNGTKNFPGNTLREYLEKNGVKFGENLNAYTSIDETVYRITNVPSRQELLDSCLLILHDWSNNLLLEDAEIDKERGVIHEEWRTRNNATSRMYEKLLPRVYGSDRYGYRWPIGLMDIVDNFKYKELRDYYRKWYRPDLQGIVIVGDVDVDWMEERIKSVFADIAKPENPAERVYFSVSDNEKPIVAISTDPEATSIQLQIFNKHETIPNEAKNELNYLNLIYIKNLIASMLNERFQEILQKQEAPIVYAQGGDGKFFLSKTKDAWTTYAVCKEGQIDNALKLLAQETQRMKQFGFTASEYERARANFLKIIENAYSEREKEKNGHYSDEYIRLFLDDEPAPGIEFEYELYKRFDGAIPLEAVNEYVKSLVPDNNAVIMLMMPQKEGIAIPTDDELLAVYNQAKAETVSGYEDKTIDTQLIKNMPEAGKVISKTAGVFGTTEWTLSNGIKAIFKKTDFKQDQILMKGISLGGSSLLDEKDMPTIQLLNGLINAGGVGDFSRTDLSKALAGKNVSVSPSIELIREGINGQCSPTDFETMLQLVYLYMTSPRADREAYEAYLARVASQLKNQNSNPMVAFTDSIAKAIYGDHPREQRLKYEMLDRIDYELALKMYRERFMNGDEFRFIFVGNINPDSLQSLVEKYLGSLPQTAKKEDCKDIKAYPRKGEYANRFARSMETAKTSSYFQYTGTCDYTLKNILSISILYQILRIVYTEKVREEEGGTYGVSVSGGLSVYPYPSFEFEIFFDTDPKLVDKLISVIYQEINEIQTNGPTETNLGKV
ncbi:MAG: insulinase family protein, partial [Bacteroidales bacterium]|nr:insulinase family protein [Bacteroidales bacterium]